MKRITVRVLLKGRERFFWGFFTDDGPFEVAQAVGIASSVRGIFGCPAWVDDDRQPATLEGIAFRERMDAMVAADLAERGESSVA